MWTGELVTTATLTVTSTFKVSSWSLTYWTSSALPMYRCTKQKGSFQENYWEIGLFISFILSYFCKTWKIVNKTISNAVCVLWLNCSCKINGVLVLITHRCWSPGVKEIKSCKVPLDKRTVSVQFYFGKAKKNIWSNTHEMGQGLGVVQQSEQKQNVVGRFGNGKFTREVRRWLTVLSTHIAASLQRDRRLRCDSAGQW